LAVASANSWAAGSSTGFVVMVVIAILLRLFPRGRLSVEELRDVVSELLRVVVEETVGADA
jgi:hypothetical protein